MRESRRVVIVTGGGKGLGAAFALAIAAEGSAVVVNNRIRAGAEDAAASVCDRIRRAGGEAIAEHSDVTDPLAAERIIGAALARYGRVDALVVNAGISGEARKVGALDGTNLRAVMETNFFSAVTLVEAALSHLQASDAGRILFVSSSAGLHGVRGRAPYAASKGALNAFALTLADELRRSAIRVNILCPYAATAMTAAEGERIDTRLLPEHAAGMAAYLVGAGCAETGEIFLAGARRYRRARTLESRGGAAPDDSSGWIAGNLDTIKAMVGAREYPGAEAAFADFYADLGNR
jgi:NAD(P)-dependent dehydrogenase (short-subunit alcohol dehydrogenase family)